MPDRPPLPLRARWAQHSPAVGGAALATGILSVGLSLAGYDVLSRVALALACAAWLGLAADLVLRLPRERARRAPETETPGALTGLAATAVLGTRFATLGRPSPAAALLALTALVWPVLLVLVVRHGERRRPGTVFLCCVATQGIAVLGATLAAAESADWLARAALALFWLGLVLGILGLALPRLDPRQVAVGAGDHWLPCGALAVSALAGSQLLAADSPGLYLWNDDNSGVLRTVTVTLLVLALAWYAVLLAAELVWPRPRYDVRRWTTVFSMGLTAAATLSVAAAVDVPWLDGPGEALLWLAVAAWLVAAAGAVRERDPAEVTSRARR